MRHSNSGQNLGTRTLNFDIFLPRDGYCFSLSLLCHLSSGGKTTEQNTGGDPTSYSQTGKLTVLIRLEFV